jgi:hypothetical protein
LAHLDKSIRNGHPARLIEAARIDSDLSLLQSDTRFQDHLE